MIRQYELVERVRSYDAKADEDLLNRAYVFSLSAHGTQIRASGDPFFSHPLEVAGILTEYRLDADTIVTALLHDTVEDTVATLDEIEHQFGAGIARLVDGVTKLSKLELKAGADSQAENFRKLVLAMSDDIRVLLVKLADRLHNMRTIHHLKSPEKRQRIAQETLDIYAPLAARLGMHRIKDELEDLAFGQINPQARVSITRRLEFLRTEAGDVVARITEALRERLATDLPGAVVEGREKRPSSIWRKMERYNVAFEQLSDVVAFRILVDDVPACYRALGLVHGAYRMVPGRFKDYISTPKRNNYRSLHSTVIGPEGQRIEVQIRTEEMHQVAELGVAAHWRYKAGIGPRDDAQYRWLRELREILEQAGSPEEFLENTKLEMFPDQVFCFSPAGDVIALPRGATPVDFAYAVHTDVGDTCVGAKVNGRTVPLRTQLRNGDQVEILRSRSGVPSPAWENYVVTGKARAAVRRFVRQQQRGEYRDLGRAIAEQAFRARDLEFTEARIADALPVLNLKSVDDAYVALGEGLLTSHFMMAKIEPRQTRWRAGGAMGAIGAINKVLPIRLWRDTAGRQRADSPDGEPAGAVPIRGLTPGMAVHYATCCHPLPGERIVGIVSKGRGVDIHTIDCPLLAEVSDDSDRWLDVRWDSQADDSALHIGQLTTVLANEPGSLGDLTTTIADQRANISNLRITQRSLDFFEMVVDVEVADVKHLTTIITALRARPTIASAERTRE